MATPTFTRTGTKASTPAKLNKDIFGLKVENHDLLKKAYISYLQDGRNAHPNVKTRGIVRGGGKKPWAQKGTGRARFGSIRNPIWTGGGIVFGPTGNENHHMNLTKRERTTALRQALSLQSANVVVIEDFQVKSAKTADAVKLINKLGVERSAVVVVENKTDELMRATDNISNANLVTADFMNINDVMNAYTIIITKSALDVLDKRLGGVK